MTLVLKGQNTIIENKNLAPTMVENMPVMIQVKEETVSTIDTLKAIFIQMSTDEFYRDLCVHAELNYSDMIKYNL